MSYFTVDELRVASPCSIEWSAMSGDDHARMCGVCDKHVYNLSILSREEGNQLIREKEGKLCVRYYRRFDGTVLTADCPTGLRMVKRQYIWARAKFVAAAITLWGLIAGSSASCSQSTLNGVPVVTDTLHHRDSIVAPPHDGNTSP
jgi:hypothetical protein